MTLELLWARKMAEGKAFYVATSPVLNTNVRSLAVPPGNNGRKAAILDAYMSILIPEFSTVPFRIGFEFYAVNTSAARIAYLEWFNGFWGTPSFKSKMHYHIPLYGMVISPTSNDRARLYRTTAISDEFPITGNNRVYWGMRGYFVDGAD